MANTKKYVSLDKLGVYDEKIKGVISTGVQAAKDYADSLASNYDAAGAAASAEAAAKSYTDGQISEVNGVVAGVKTTAEQGVTDAATAKAAADKAQGDVDGLKTYVGTIPEGATATDVIGYVQEKTTGIASEGAMTELGNRVGVVEGKVATIEGDYLKAADKTELEGKITTAQTTVQTAVDTEKSRAEGIEAGLETRLKAVEDDYLKAADKTELQGNIDTLTGVVETLSEGVDAEKVDGVKDLIAYVEEHGTEVTGMKKDISDNAGAIAAEAERAKGEEAKNAQAAAAAKTAADNAQAAADAEAERAKGIEGGFETRIAAIETQLGDGEGSVSDQIADAKSEAVSEATAAAATDAKNKADAAESAAKGHADGLNTAMNARVEALEAIDHDHSNKAELDLIASGDKAKWDTAAAKAHEHANAAVLDGITAENITTWNTVTSKAAQSDLTAVSDRVTTLETWHTNFVEASEEEINDLFKA